MKNFIPPKPKGRPATSYSAFTLLELLVTIGIIGVLASLLFPAFASVRRNAKTVVCLSNLRQCGVLIHQYAGEHDYSFPPANANGGQGYIAALSGYLAKSQTMTAKNIYVSPAAVYPTTAYGGTQFTYAVHNGLFGGANQAPVKTMAVTRPSEVIMMANGAQIKAYGYHCAFTFWEPWELNQGKGVNAVSYLNKPIPAADSTNVDDWAGEGFLRYVQNNNKAINVLMVDGHAETIAKGKILYKNVVYDQ